MQVTSTDLVSTGRYSQMLPQRSGLSFNPAPDGEFLRHRLAGRYVCVIMTRIDLREFASFRIDLHPGDADDENDAVSELYTFRPDGSSVLLHYAAESMPLGVGGASTISGYMRGDTAA